MHTEYREEELMQWALLVTSILVLIWLIFSYNRLVRHRNMVREAWSGIDVQLKRRYNLIPNLVEAVKGYSAHEKGLYEELARLRSRTLEVKDAGTKGNIENAITGGLKSLFALAEAYPQLKANTNFLKLQDQLVEIEDNIQLARRYYNGTIRNYNIRVESFPGNLVAKLFGFGREEFFTLELVTQREAPAVKLA